MKESPTAWPAPPRETVRVQLVGGGTYEGPVGAPLGTFIQAAYPEAEHLIVAALVDGELEELSYSVTRDVRVRPVDASTNDGMRIYQRSLSFLLVAAVSELHPGAKVVIDHSVTLGGFFCSLIGRDGLSETELQAVEERMREIVEADEAIVKERIPTKKAIELFASQGYHDKARLLAYREEEEITIYALHGVRDYFYGCMMPGTGSLRWFALELYPPGFILRLPRRQNPTELPLRRDYPKLMGVFREYGRWLSILGIEDIGSLNEAVEEGRMRQAILVSEALHEKRIADIADDIASRSEPVRLVLIAGPSSSGKTTFARRLAIQLMVNGYMPFALGLDDYFVDRELTLRDEKGAYDFEALEAIDVPLFNEQLMALMSGDAVRPRHYDFQTGKGEEGEEVRLPEDTIIIVEGIHGLNPQLLSGVPSECAYRVYVSALTQLNIDHHNRVPTTDTRLLRRMVRDARYRGYPARMTIERWESVRRGEERNIFPYQENADVMFNSALVYELSVLKPFAEPLLLRVPRDTLESIEARRLLGFLRWVRACEPDLVPDNSLLREFIGESILRDFTF